MAGAWGSRGELVCGQRGRVGPPSWGPYRRPACLGFTRSACCPSLAAAPPPKFVPATGQQQQQQEPSGAEPAQEPAAAGAAPAAAAAAAAPVELTPGEAAPAVGEGAEAKAPATAKSLNKTGPTTVFVKYLADEVGPGRGRPAGGQGRTRWQILLRQNSGQLCCLGKLGTGPGALLASTIRRPGVYHFAFQPAHVPAPLFGGTAPTFSPCAPARWGTPSWRPCLRPAGPSRRSG